LASPKAGYPISGRIFCSKFKCLLKYEIIQKPDATKASFLKLDPKHFVVSKVFPFLKMIFAITIELF
jgi:hypothetical protein